MFFFISLLRDLSAQTRTYSQQIKSQTDANVKKKLISFFRLYSANHVLVPRAREGENCYFEINTFEKIMKICIKIEANKTASRSHWKYWWFQLSGIVRVCTFCRDPVNKSVNEANVLVTWNFGISFKISSKAARDSLWTWRYFRLFLLLSVFFAWRLSHWWFMLSLVWISHNYHKSTLTSEQLT